MSTPPDPGRDRKPSFWAVLASAPHRLFLFGGAVQIVLAVSLWAAVLVGRFTGSPVTLALPDLWLHTFLMAYGIFPYYIFGFLFTVYPRWMRIRPVPAAQYVRVSQLMLAGWLLFYVGLVVGATVVAAGVALLAAGFLHALASLLAIYREAPESGVHERLLNFALVLGLIGLASFLYATVTGSPAAFTAAREFGLWLFIVPVVFTVSHRMIPFFSSSELMNYVMVRPSWGPPIMLICATGHAACELLGLPQWRWLFDLPLAVTALHHSYVWQFRRSFHSRLLAMTHVAFLWLGVAMTLYAAQSLLWLVTGSDMFGRAPLHALGIGFLTGMVVAMGSRVTLGHSGRAMVADTRTWVALLGLGATAIIRMAAEFAPAWSGWLNLAAAAAWLLCLVPWVLQYAPMYLRPRADGRAG
jgi:uncharacterized protein involved in response to NO